MEKDKFRNPKFLSSNSSSLDPLLDPSSHIKSHVIFRNKLCRDYGWLASSIAGMQSLGWQETKEIHRIYRTDR